MERKNPWGTGNIEGLPLMQITFIYLGVHIVFHILLDHFKTNGSITKKVIYVQIYTSTDSMKCTDSSMVDC